MAGGSGNGRWPATMKGVGHCLAYAWLTRPLGVVGLEEEEEEEVAERAWARIGAAGLCSC